MKSFKNPVFSFLLLFSQIKNDFNKVCLQPGFLPEVHSPQIPNSLCASAQQSDSSHAVCSTHTFIFPSAWVRAPSSGLTLLCSRASCIYSKALSKHFRMSSMRLVQCSALRLGLSLLILTTAKAHSPSTWPSVCPPVSQHMLKMVGPLPGSTMQWHHMVSQQSAGVGVRTA